MKRRDFMRLSASASGMLLCGGVRMAMAQQAFSGPYWLFIEARGGWDPTSFCDPKGSGLGPNGDINNYDQGDIRQIGNIRYAPPPDSFSGSSLYSNRDFFEAHYQRMVVINGINYGTNSHEVGRTASWTGSRALNYPSVGALVAAENAPDLSLPIVANSNSESSRTNGLAVPRTIVRGSDLNAIREIAYPDRVNVGNPTAYHAGSVRALLDSATAARRQRQMAEQRLLRLQAALSRHNAARNRDVNSLTDFVDNLENTTAPTGQVNSSGRSRSLFNQAQTAFAAFESGAAASAQIDMNSFDTHSDHDARHYPALSDYFAAVNSIIDDAMARGFGNNLIIVMGSDFARTNKYNNDNGKDHWSHTSMMVWGAPGLLSGNRVVGATDNEQRSLRINPSTLALDPNGIELTPEYVHQALRDLAGIAQNPSVSSGFPFAEQVLPIFT